MKAILAIGFLLLASAAPAIARTAPFQPQSSALSTGASLSEAQQRAIKRIKAASGRKAVLPALRLAGIVRRIYNNMLADKPDEKLRVKLSAELKETTWELLTIKGQAIRETVNALTREQKQLIKDEMRKPGAPADLGELIDHTFKLGGEK